MKSTALAYLAPEIPALSATFVYNEILTLEAMGVEVLPITVHVPGVIPGEPRVQALHAKAITLYGGCRACLPLLHLRWLVRRPWRYLGTLGRFLGDLFQVGPWTHTGRGLVFRFLMAARLADLLAARGVAHLHVHFAHIPTDLAMYATGLSGLPFSFTSHANDLFERGWLLRRKVERAAFAATISEFNVRLLRGLGAPAEKLEVVRCGVDPDTFGTLERKAPGSPMVVGSLGRFVEKKGFDDLVRALAALRDDGVDLRVEIAGDGPLLEGCRALAKELGVADRIAFKGAIPHAEVGAWLRGLDLFALPCRKDRNGDMDGIPVVLMEAMMTGVPVVTTRISGIPELVLDRETGLLVEPDDPAALAEAIRALMEDPALRKRVVAGGVAKVRADFCLASNVERLHGLIGPERVGSAQGGVEVGS